MSSGRFLSAPPDLEDQALPSDAVINAKLDAILKAHQPPGRDAGAEVSPRHISGSGLRFYSSERFVVGTSWKSNPLPASGRSLLVYGHVVRSEP